VQTRLDHVVIHVSDWQRSNAFYRDEQLNVHGPVTRYGGRGKGTSVYFRDPDGSLLELISYER
jgi:catechol 2,3-dioxygenase-like lactoylglutathione lyase family enzyme